MFSRVKIPVHTEATKSQSRPTFSIVVISPHFDDAVLSCSQPLLAAVERGQSALVITVFTQGQDQILSADSQSFLGGSSAPSAQALFRARAHEDQAALKVLSANQPSKATIHWQHLGLVDGLFRVDQHQHLMYPSFKALFSGQLHSADQLTLQELTAQLLSLKKNVTTTRTQIWAPLGVGHHADHLLTHQAVAQVFDNVHWWEDTPYHLEYLHVLQRQSELTSYTRHQVNLSKLQAEFKWRAVRKYTSQLTGLYQEGINQANLSLEAWYQL